MRMIGRFIVLWAGYSGIFLADRLPWWGALPLCLLSGSLVYLAYRDGFIEKGV